MPNSIAENLERLTTARSDIHNAIVAKGGTSSLTSGFEDFSSEIESIPDAPSPELITKNINVNGTYIAEDDEADGYSSVTVNVPDGEYEIPPQECTKPRVQNERINPGFACFWITKNWKGMEGVSTYQGSYIWTDGENIYYSYSSTQYVLDKSTSTWSVKTWTGLTPRGDYIWTDGENIYYSGNNDQYVLDKATSTWSAKTWNGLTSFSGENIWTDGENIYYSSSSTQYVLDKATSTWSTKTWNGLMSFRGSYIWTDGENIYYSSSSTQYVLDKATSTWSAKTWNGQTSFSGEDIWTDGENIYLEHGNWPMFLDRTTSTWYDTKSYIYARGIWSDGTNIYCYSKNSNRSVSYIMARTSACNPLTITTNCRPKYTT